MSKPLNLLAVFSLMVAASATDAATYGYAPTPFNWIDNNSHSDVKWSSTSECSGGGAPVDDDITPLIDIGFVFTYGTTDYKQLRVMSNGRLQFENNYCYFGTQTVGPPPTYPLPYPDGNLDNTMRVYGADFCPEGGGAGCAGRVTQQSFDIGACPTSAANACFVVTWSQVREWNSDTSRFSIQAILYDNGDFVYQYKDIANVSQGNAQVGWQLNKSDYGLIDFSTVNSLSYSAIRFYQPSIPIAEYRFDECSATGTVDSSGNKLGGTITGGVTPATTGIVCTAYTFDGIKSYVSVADNPLLSPKNITLAAWVRHSKASFKNWETLLAKGDSAYRLHLNGGCDMNGIKTANAFTFGLNGGCDSADLSSGVVPVANQWYHVVGTYDGATIKIFVNGALTNSQPLADDIKSNATPLFIGENADSTGRNWSGDIDEVKIYDQALQDNEVQSLYNNESRGLQRDGTLRSCSVCGATLGNFNAFETSTAAGSVTGVIKTKIAGTNFAASSGNIDIVSLSGGVLATFSGNINVQFLDASDNSGAMDGKGCRSSWKLISTDTGLATVTVNFAKQNRVSLSAVTPANSWPVVRVKVTSQSTPGNYGCSSDAFAIRPSYIEVAAQAQDATWQTAGNARTLNNQAASGGIVHAAGLPFSLSGLTARSATSAATTNYAQFGTWQPCITGSRLLRQ
jgi:Concanavalin A-like lectin/glucanases superfamily